MWVQHVYKDERTNEKKVYFISHLQFLTFLQEKMNSLDHTNHHDTLFY